MIVAGIDVGALTTKAVVISKNGSSEILGYSIVLPALGEEATADVLARRALDQALVKAGADEKSLTGMTATGTGRRDITFITQQKSLLVCLAEGAHFLNPGIHTVIDIGAESATVVRLDDRGKVEDSANNDRCASGTGVFLEAMAKLMRMSMEEFAQASFAGRDRAEISSMCAIFAESEVISHIHRIPATPKNDVIKGIHGSMAVRISGQAKRVGVKPEVMVSGGVARNVGLIKELEEELKNKVFMPPEPQLVAAVGAALLAA